MFCPRAYENENWEQHVFQSNEFLSTLSFPVLLKEVGANTNGQAKTEKLITVAFTILTLS